MDIVSEIVKDIIDNIIDNLETESIGEPKRRKYDIKYYKKNKDKISVNKKQYYIDTKKDRLQYSNDYNNRNKERLRQKRELNKIEINRKQRERYRLKKEQREKLNNTNKDTEE